MVKTALQEHPKSFFLWGGGNCAVAGAWEQPGGAVGNLRMLDLPARSTLSPPAEVAVLVSPTGDTQPPPTCPTAPAGGP